MRLSPPLLVAALLLALAAGFWIGRQDAESAANADSRSANTESDATESGEVGSSTAEGHASTSDPARSAQAILVQDADASDSQFAPEVSAPSIAPSRPGQARITEQSLLSDGGVRHETAQLLEKDASFQGILSGLSRAADAQSLEKTRIYRERLASELKQNPAFAVDSIICGKHLCVASVLGPADQAEIFNNLLTNDSKEAKAYAVLNAVVPRPGNAEVFENRLLFTIDPAYNGIVIMDPRR